MMVFILFLYIFKAGLVEDLPLHDTGFVQQLHTTSSAQDLALRGVEALRLLGISEKDVMFVPGTAVRYDLSALQPEHILLPAGFEEDLRKKVDADGD